MLVYNVSLGFTFLQTLYYLKLSKYLDASKLGGVQFIMQNGFSSFAAATAVLLALPYGALGLYSKSSPVLQVNAKNYDNLIARSNHTSVRLHVQFYAQHDG